MSADGVIARITEIRQAHGMVPPAATTTAAPSSGRGPAAASGDLLSPAGGITSFADLLDAASARRRLVSSITGEVVAGPSSFGGDAAPSAPGLAAPGVAGPGLTWPGALAGGSAPATGDLGPLPEAARRYVGVLDAAAAAEGVDPTLLRAVAWTESNFDASAVSRAGATGLLQLMPQTAAHLGVDPTDPADNARGGARYLRQQLDRFGRVDLALAAYNAGPGAVQRHGGIPPYAETQAYVRRVLERAQMLGGTR